MSEGRRDVQKPADVDATRDDDYVAPRLTDLGSFEELTTFDPGGDFSDTEGFSVSS